jgi:hypothetical protein
MKSWNITILTFFIAFLSLFHIGTANAQQCHIVRIATETRGNKSNIYLYPSELSVDRGTCVIWINDDPHEKVSINFHDNSKSCIVASDASSGFRVLEGCFLTDLLDYGQTVSVRFKESGIFIYQLEIIEKPLLKNGDEKRKIIREGKIIVE